MIEKGELERIARMGNLAPYQQEKHYIQNVALWSIANESANELVFKGGTALWFFYGLNRFSEDLDFTAIKEVGYESLMKAVEEQFGFRNIRASFKKIESTRGFSFRIGAEGPLFEEEKHRCFIRVEISERSDLLLEPELKTYVSPYDELPPLSIRVMDPTEMLAEKVRAILMRDKARDIYDLWFLLRKDVKVDRALIGKKLGNPFQHDALLGKIDRTRKEWETGLGWMVFGQVPPFAQVRKEISEIMGSRLG